jgi:hypothetical protein
MRMRTTWLPMAAILLASIVVVAAQAAEESDYTKKMRELHRRNLPKYIKQLHQPQTQNSPFEYEELLQWIANSRDHRAIPTMIEVMSDTLTRPTGDAQLIAADFLGSMGSEVLFPS